MLHQKHASRPTPLLTGVIFPCCSRWFQFPPADRLSSSLLLSHAVIHHAWLDQCRLAQIAKQVFLTATDEAKLLIRAVGSGQKKLQSLKKKMTLKLLYLPPSHGSINAMAISFCYPACHSTVLLRGLLLMSAAPLCTLT